MRTSEILTPLPEFLCWLHPCSNLKSTRSHGRRLRGTADDGLLQNLRWGTALAYSYVPSIISEIGPTLYYHKHLSFFRQSTCQKGLKKVIRKFCLKNFWIR